MKGLTLVRNLMHACTAEGNLRRLVIEGNTIEDIMIRKYTIV